jgi:hypothetical protein
MDNRHGEIQQKFVGSVLMIKPIGAINQQTAELAVAQTKKLVMQMSSDTKWGICIDMSEYQGHTPDTTASIECIRAFCKERNQVCEAYVIGENAFIESIVQFFLESQSVVISYDFFQSTEQAIPWIKSQI